MSTTRIVVKKKSVEQKGPAPLATADARVKQQVRVMETIGSGAENIAPPNGRSSPRTKAYVKRLTPVLGFLGYTAADIAALVCRCNHDEEDIQAEVALILEDRSQFNGWEVKGKKKEKKKEQKAEEQLVERKDRKQDGREQCPPQKPPEQKEAAASKPVYGSDYNNSSAHGIISSPPTQPSMPAFEDPAILFVSAKPAQNPLVSSGPPGLEPPDTLLASEENQDNEWPEEEWSEWWNQTKDDWQDEGEDVPDIVASVASFGLAPLKSGSTTPGSELGGEHNSECHDMAHGIYSEKSNSYAGEDAYEEIAFGCVTPVPRTDEAVGEDLWDSPEKTAPVEDLWDMPGKAVNAGATRLDQFTLGDIRQGEQDLGSRKIPSPTLLPSLPPGAGRMLADLEAETVRKPGAGHMVTDLEAIPSHECGRADYSAVKPAPPMPPASLPRGGYMVADLEAATVREHASMGAAPMHAPSSLPLSSGHMVTEIEARTFHKMSPPAQPPSVQQISPTLPPCLPPGSARMVTELEANALLSRVPAPPTHAPFQAPPAHLPMQSPAPPSHPPMQSQAPPAHPPMQSPAPPAHPPTQPQAPPAHPPMQCQAPPLHAPGQATKTPTLSAGDVEAAIFGELGISLPTSGDCPKEWQVQMAEKARDGEFQRQQAAEEHQRRYEQELAQLLAAGEQQRHRNQQLLSQQQQLIEDQKRQLNALQAHWMNGNQQQNASPFQAALGHSAGAPPAPTAVPPPTSVAPTLRELQYLQAQQAHAAQLQAAQQAQAQQAQAQQAQAAQWAYAAQQAQAQAQGQVTSGTTWYGHGAHQQPYGAPGLSCQSQHQQMQHVEQQGLPDSEAWARAAQAYMEKKQRIQEGAAH